ncbi:MAG: BamA/TamA family outer membrane protein [Bacteroidota bacterium]
MIIKIAYDFIRTNHNYLCSFVFTLLFISQSLPAQSLRSFEATGNHVFSSSNYIRWSGLNFPSSVFPGIEDSIKNRISKALRSEGYYNFRINRISLSRVDSSSSKIVLDINENSPTLINKVYFNHAQADSTFLNRTFSELTGKIFSINTIITTAESILTYYENNGYPFANVRIESIFFFDDSTNNNHYANIYLAIDPGKQTFVNKIEISGNSKTKDYVITRALSINTGELYNQKLIDNTPERLNRLRIFEPVTQPDFYFNSREEGILKITVKEKETNNFDGIIGYIPALTQNEKGFLTGFININLRNLFGTGRAASFKWMQESRASQELEIRYLEPWLLDLPFNIETGLYQRKQDSTYVQRNIEGKFEYIATQEVTASLILGSQTTIPTERADKKFTVFSSTSFAAGFNLRIDTRDNFYAPRQGIILSNTYKYTSKRVEGQNEYLSTSIPAKVNFQKLEIDFSYFLEIFNNQILVTGIHARELKGENVEISDLYLLGGTSTLRGYREKQFAGNRILWSNFEYRYLLSNSSFAFLFLDTGYILRNEDLSRSIQKISVFKLGYGLGFNIETTLGILGVSFALGQGDSLRDGKIHFGIVNEF